MSTRHDAHVLIVGGGATGGGLAHDLALRGLRVTLVDRGEVTSGTSGRHHGLLHSGARYAVGDREAGVECIRENMILKRIAPGTFECNDGLFVAVCEEDLEYLEPLIEGCTGAGIPVQRLDAAEALRLEPNLNPELKAAVRVPDATVDPMRLILRFLGTARHNGADIRPYMEVIGLVVHDGVVSGAAVRDHVTGKEGEIHADIVVNAAGPWSGRVAAMAGAGVPITPSPGCAARAPRPLLQHGDQPDAQVRRRRHRRPSARPLDRRYELLGGRGPRRADRCPRTTSSACTPRDRS